MAESHTHTEREYVIPLRKRYLKVSQYRRTRRAVKIIKEFVARHMKVPEHDIDKVKLDVYFNNELWLRGKTNPPSKVKVKVRREGDLVHVTFVEVPERVKFAKAKHERFHKASEKKESRAEKPEVKEEKTEEQKTDEKEKEKSVAESKAADIKQDAKAEKHVTKAEKMTRPHRMALQK